MEWVNITARTLPEAIDLALDNLGVDEAEAEIEVLEEPRQGLFGRTRGNARVKARVKPKESRPKDGRGRNRRRKNDGGGDGRQQGRSRKRSGGEGGPSGDSRQGKSGGRAEGGRKPKDQDQNRSDQGGSKADKAPAAKGGPKKQKNEAPMKEATMEEVTEQVEVFLTGLVEAMGLEGGVRIDSDEDDGIIGVVEGQHGLLIGPRGRTLEAVQELTRVTAQRSAPSSIRIKVDVGGYREIRAEALRSFAAKAAEAALADGKERALEPMNSVDRKIVHDALSDRTDVETRSDGTDPSRRVVVMPVVAAGADDVEDDGDDAEGSDDQVMVEEAEAVNGSDPAEAATEDAEAEREYDDGDVADQSDDDADEDSEPTEAAVVD